MTRSSKVVMIIAIVLTVAVMAGVIVWLAVRLNDESMRAEAARREVRNACESALYDSLDSVGEMENNLAKLMASDSAAYDIVIAADIYKSAGAASEAVGRLPVDPQRYEGLRKFLNQVGDFAACYIRALGERGVCVSGGSACTRGRASHVLLAQGLPKSNIDAALRVSLCPESTEEMIDCFLEALGQAARLF